jgi:hypothetical protein
MTKKQTEKRRYQKPELTQVSLRPEEAVLAVCKTGSVSGVGNPACTAPPKCSQTGS